MGLIYQKNLLHFGEEKSCAILPLAQERQHPFYLYDLDGMRARAIKMHSCYPAIEPHYAMKANSADRILKAFLEELTGVDVVSGGEIERALRVGFHPDKIIFSGVGKTKAELDLAIGLEIKQINVESPEELKRIISMAQSMGKKPNVAFRINPDVDAKTHPYITTGFRENKFGMAETFLPELKSILKSASNAVNFCGLTLHIGSQLQDLSPLEDAIGKTLQVFHALNAEGYNLKTFDVGGGLGISYTEEHKFPSKDFELLDGYAKMLQRVLKGFTGKVLCEPGRILVGSCGTLVGEVQYVKEAPERNFLILNTGIHHLIRPALYQAKHRIMPLELHDRKKKNYDVVGPICESSDVLAKNISMQETFSGEFVAIADAGAYGYAMASTYNEHELPEQLFWENGKIH